MSSFLSSGCFLLTESETCCFFDNKLFPLDNLQDNTRARFLNYTTDRKTHGRAALDISPPRVFCHAKVWPQKIESVIGSIWNATWFFVTHQHLSSKHERNPLQALQYTSYYRSVLLNSYRHIQQTKGKQKTSQLQNNEHDGNSTIKTALTRKCNYPTQMSRG